MSQPLPICHAPAARLLQAGIAAPPLPAVTVVLPVRGCRSHSVANWEAILDLDYGKERVAAQCWCVSRW